MNGFFDNGPTWTSFTEELVDSFTSGYFNPEEESAKPTNSAQNPRKEDLSAEKATALENQREATRILQEDIQRLNAEYVNYRKRVERDREVSRDQALSGVFHRMLPTLDAIVAARKFGDLEEGSPFAGIANNMERALADLGLERIDAAGVPFDPTVHEAVLRQPDVKIEEDYIVAVLREGYVFGEKVVRATQVIVSAGSAE